MYISDSFKKVKYLYHFTKFENFKSIVSNFCLYMMPISDNLNDKKEQEYVKGIDEYYITCFTSEINDLFWNHKDYGKNSSEAVCIAIKNQNLDKLLFRYENYEAIEKTDRITNYKRNGNYTDFGLFDISCHDVIYKINPEEDDTFDYDMYDLLKDCANISKERLKNDCTYIHNRAYVKTKFTRDGIDQSRENEVRIIAIMTYKGVSVPEPKPYFYIKKILLDFSQIKDNFIVYVKDDFKYKEEFVKICDSKVITYRILN